MPPRHQAAWLAACLALSGCGAGLHPDGRAPAPGDVRILQAGPNVPAEDVLVRLWANGSARSTSGPERFLSFSIQATEDPITGLTLGTLFISDSINNVSFFGAILNGDLVPRGSGTGADSTVGLGMFNGVLARGTAFTLTMVDANSSRVSDTITFNVPGQINFSGRVFRKDIRIVRAVRPDDNLDEDGFEDVPAGTTFDQPIGLFLFNADANTCLGPQEPIPREVLELTPPEPIIDFQRNREGGMLQPPGKENNVPQGEDPFITPYFDPEGFPFNNEIGEDDGGNGGNGGNGNSGSGNGGNGNSGSGNGGNGTTDPEDCEPVD